MNGGAVEGVLIDVDGVLFVGDEAIPGAPETLAELRRRGIPFTLLTNTTLRSRTALAAALGRLGFDIGPADIMTAAGATADYVRQHYPGQPCHLLVSGDVADEFRGIPLTDDERDARVVVMGGAGPEFSFAAINTVYRMLRGGAAFVAMHKNTHWLTAEGITVDSGVWVHGLEYAAGVEATVVGKPSAPFFEAGYRALGLDPARVAMVGDSNRFDVQPAMRLGSTGVLLRTGVFDEADLAAGDPSALLESIADLPAWLDAPIRHS